MAAAVPIPALWCIDVEPDGFQPRGEPWTGVAAVVDLVDRLRGPLGDRSGHPVHPTWFLRLDPAIAQACGRADFVFERHGHELDRIAAAGDTFGIHVHPYRWDVARQVWYTDHTDPAWNRHCIEAAVDTFTKRFGHPPAAHRFGSALLDDHILEAAAAMGAEVDMTAEPGLRPQVHDPSFGAYATGPGTDYRDFPTRPHRRVDGRLLLVPLSAYDDVKARMSLARRVGRRLAGRPPTHLRPMSMWRSWPSPQLYWDLVTRMLDASRHPYFAFAVRTHAPGDEPFRRVTTVLEHLPSHAVASRLRFTDPLDAAVGALAP